jgi:hypothetical protein
LGHLVHKGLQRGDDACMKIGLGTTWFAPIVLL